MSRNGIKITDLIKTKQFTYSIEVTPDISMEEINSLTVNPLFFSVTWHSRIHLCKNVDVPPLGLAVDLKNKGKNVLLHLSCDLLRVGYLDEVIKKLQGNGICNLFVMLGNSYDPNESDFKSSKELIKYIRLQTGDYFCIGVAGNPDGSDKQWNSLKDKIDIGANFIITQAFFESKYFEKYVDDCTENEITVPIIPGFFVYDTFLELERFVTKCKVKVSDDFIERAKNISLVRYNHETIKSMKRKIAEDKSNCSNFHFFTLNKLNKVSLFVKSCF